jgi:hypothetical protein
MYDTHDIAMALREILDPFAHDHENELLAEIDSVTTYEDAGVLTRDAGFVLRFRDHTEYQVTIVRSR